MLSFIKSVFTSVKSPQRFATNKDFIKIAFIASQINDPKHHDKCSIEVRHSCLGEHAGAGVFSTKSIQKGELLTLYPGNVFPYPEHLVTASELSEHYGSEFVVNSATLADKLSKSYIISSGFGGFIDGNVEDWAFTSPLTSGHKVNHPPKNIKPNVDVLHFHWSDVQDLIMKTNDNNTDIIGRNITLSEFQDQHMTKITNK